MKKRPMWGAISTKQRPQTTQSITLQQCNQNLKTIHGLELDAVKDGSSANLKEKTIADEAMEKHDVLAV